MKILREIFGRIWAVWGLLFFILTMLVFMIPFLLFSYSTTEPKRTIRFITYSRVWMGVFLTCIGCPLTVKGKKNFKPGENYIVLCNHNSLMDVPVSSPSIPGGNKTIAKSEIAKIPLFGMIYRVGSVLVDRKSDTSRKESYLKMKKVLELGLHMCIYPEGTRNKSDQPLKSFHNGAFRLALDSQKAIIPGVIFNTKKVLPADKFFYVFPHKLQIHFLPSISSTGEDTADSLQKRVYEIMKNYYLENQD